MSTRSEDKANNVMAREEITACVYTIGGLDPSGGAGLPADARAMRAFGAHSCAVATAVVAQNTLGVARVEAVSSAMLQAQLDNLRADIAPRAIKIGMLPNAKTVEIVARFASENRVATILDPVFAPSGGDAFSNHETAFHIARQLFPLCELVTPNALEAAQLCEFEIQNLDDMKRAAHLIIERFGAHRVLVKGGHLPHNESGSDSGDEVVDILCDATSIVELRAPRIAGREVRGTGCLLASAIAAQRAQNIEIETAARRAKSWLSDQIRDAQNLGKGRRVAV